MGQHSYPTSDSQVGSWGTAPLYSKVDDVTPDDTDFITFGSVPGTTPFILGMGTITTPNLTRGRVYLRCRAKHTGKESARMTLVLKDSSATTVSTWTFGLTSDFVSYCHSLDATELALAASWASMTLTGSYAGTGMVSVSSLELEDTGTEDKGGYDATSEEDLRNGAYCSLTGYWYPASQLMTVDGKRVWIGTKRTPRRETEE